MVDNATTAAAVAATDRATSPGTESKSFFLVVMELFFGRWMLICGIFFSATLWSYLALTRAPDTYEAVGQILIRRGKVQSIQNMPILRQEEEVGSEVDILLSNAVVEETVEKLLEEAAAEDITDTGAQPLIFGVYKAQRPFNRLRRSDLPMTDPALLRKLLKNQLRIRKFGESNVIEVSLIGVNAMFAAEAVNMLIDVYEKFNLQVERLPGQSDYYRQEIVGLDQEIDALQVQLASYKEKHGVASLEKERELLTLRRYASQTELDKLQVDKTGLETDLAAVNNPATRLQAAFLRNDRAILVLRENIFLREHEVAGLRSKSTEDNPLVKAKQDELVELRANLAREEELAIAQQRHLYRQLLDKEAEVLDKIGQMDRLLSKFPTMEIEIDRLDRDIKQRTLKRIDVVEQMIRASTLENPDQTLNKVKVLGYAQVPPFPREARKAFKFMVAMILSLIASFLVGLFVEGLDHTIRRREEIEEHLHVPYLASLGIHWR